MISTSQNLDQKLDYLEITMESLAVFSQKLCDLCSFTLPCLVTLLKLILYGLNSDLKVLPEWLYKVKKCRFLAKISKSYFKSVQPLTEYLSSKNHSRRFMCKVVQCAKDKKNPKWHLMFSA